MELLTCSNITKIYFIRHASRLFFQNGCYSAILFFSFVDVSCESEPHFELKNENEIQKYVKYHREQDFR